MGRGVALEKVIFFGNGPLAEYALAVLKRECQVIFVAHSLADLEEACRLKRDIPEAHGVLASFGVIIREDVLELFEPEGILNIHPSLLPQYRGASPIESAILDGASDFSVSVMKLALEMDAGPVYYQTTFTGVEIGNTTKVAVEDGLPLDKLAIYRVLAETGAKWICDNLGDLPTPVLQAGKPTFCGKFTKKMGVLQPETDTAELTLRKIVAFQGYPKPKYAFFGTNCTILGAHMLSKGEIAVLPLPCADGGVIAIDRLQPEGRKAMDAKSFKNGYGRAEG